MVKCTKGVVNMENNARIVKFMQKTTFSEFDRSCVKQDKGEYQVKSCRKMCYF